MRTLGFFQKYSLSLFFSYTPTRCTPVHSLSTKTNTNVNAARDMAIALVDIVTFQLVLRAKTGNHVPVAYMNGTYHVSNRLNMKLAAVAGGVVFVTSQFFLKRYIIFLRSSLPHILFLLRGYRLPEVSPPVVLIVCKANLFLYILGFLLSDTTVCRLHIEHTSDQSVHIGSFRSILFNKRQKQAPFLEQ